MFSTPTQVLHNLASRGHGSTPQKRMPPPIAMKKCWYKKWHDHQPIVSILKSTELERQSCRPFALGRYCLVVGTKTKILPHQGSFAAGTFASNRRRALVFLCLSHASLNSSHLVGSVLNLPRDRLQILPVVGAAGRDGELVLAPRSAHVHVHLQATVKFVRVRLGSVYRAVNSCVYAVFGHWFPSVVLHRIRSSVFDGMATLVRNLPAGATWKSICCMDAPQDSTLLGPTLR